MAAVDHFVSIPFRRLVRNDLDNSGLHSGTSSTATDFIELRWQSNDGTNPTGVTRQDVLIALEVFERFIKEGGIVGDGTDVPAL